MKRKRRNDKFILNKHGEPVAEPSLFKWGRWFQESRTARVVKQEWVENVRISTVFLGLDHSWMGGAPVLWGTMCFTNYGPLAGEMDRCSGGREQAEAMHQRMVERVKAELVAKKGKTK